MKVTVKLFASFQAGRFNKEIRDYPDQTSIGSIVQELNIPEEEVGILLLNDAAVKWPFDRCAQAAGGEAL